MIAFDPIYTHPAPQNHRFPMEKYALLYEALLWEGIAEPTDFFTPEPASFEQLILVHSPTYVRQFLSLTLPQREAIRIGFQQSEQLVRKQRDTLVYEYIQRYRLPIQCSMGGGYSPKIDTILKVHTNTFRVFLS